MAPGRAATVFLLVAAFITVAGATPVAAQDFTIYAGGYRFDPTLGLPLDVPELLRSEGYAPGERGLWFVQYPFPNRERADALVAAEGFVRVEGTTLWVGTPEQAARVRSLPFVRYIGPWYPFEKGTYVTRFDPRMRLSFHVTLANVDGVEEAFADIASYAEVFRSSIGGDAGVIVQQQQLLRLMHNRYLISFGSINVTPLAPPWLVSVLPRSALPSNHVVISGIAFDACAPRLTIPCIASPPRVTFRGVSSPRVWVRDMYRLEAEVPAGLEPGPADIIVSGWASSQILPGDIAGGFSVGPVGRRVFARDDVVEAEWVPYCCFEGGSYRFRWRDAVGVTRLLADLVPTTVAFDGDGRLLMATETGSAWYDVAMERTSPGPKEAANATALLFDAQNNLVVVTSSSITRLAPNGKVLGRVEEGADGADLDTDGCTLYLAGSPTRRFDVCSMTSLGPLPGIHGYVQLLPDGTLLAIAGEHLVRRQRRDGSVIAEISTTRYVHSGHMAVSSGGDYVHISLDLRFDLVSNTLGAVDRDEVDDLSFPISLAIYGGWTAARGFAHYADGEVDPTPPRRRSVR